MWLINTLENGGTRGVTGWLMLALTASFWVWMFIDSIRRGEFAWSFMIFITYMFGAAFYFFYVYRQSAALSVRGFELPGAQSRRRIRELEAQIHHLDKAHHHSQLGDVYFQRGRMSKAEACYRAALERDAEDLDTRSHLGQCLLRQGRAAEARPLLESVCTADPRHEYGYTMMAYAETLATLGEKDNAIEVWRRVNGEHSYTRARIQLAELLIGKGQGAEARTLIEEVLGEDRHAPVFERKRSRVWVRRARALKRRLG